MLMDNVSSVYDSWTVGLKAFNYNCNEDIRLVCQQEDVGSDILTPKINKDDMYLHIFKSVAQTIHP